MPVREARPARHGACGYPRSHGPVHEGRYPAAMREYAQILAEDPKNLKALVGRGKVSLHTGKIQLAMEDFKSVLEIDPTDPEANRLLAQLEVERPEETSP